MLTYRTNKKIRSGKIGFNAILIGNGKLATDLYKNLQSEKKAQGQYFVGYIPITKSTNNKTDLPLPLLGNIGEIEILLVQHKIEEIFIVPESGEESYLPLILSHCIADNLVIKIRPSTENILIGAVRNFSVNSIPLIQLSFERMSMWQRFLRRSAEISGCIVAGIIISPLLAYAAYKVRKSSPGPIFYSQQRLGLHGKPFLIYKFRSMYMGAEKETPLLTGENDERVTPWGKIMRKYRIDELPQLYNVLNGDMSIVGPRPERAYYVEQIVKKAPHYRLLFNVKPGVTSWGEAKYGYAENVDEMIERMAYDLVYLENQSLVMDLKILLYTVGVVFRGEGQ